MPVSPVTPATSRSAHTRARLSRRRLGEGGFTLLELLVVIAIIAILAGIVLGVGRRASESGKIARAKAEMAALSTALEAYKSQYGDYPQTGAVVNNPLAPAPATDDGPGILFNALTGKRGPKTALTPMDVRSLVELAKFPLQVPDRFPVSGNMTQLANAFVDPWGHRYLYVYDTVANGWKNSSFILMSAGPDEAATFPLPADGIISAAYETAQLNGKAVNTDNLYANRN